MEAGEPAITDLLAIDVLSLAPEERDTQVAAPARFDVDPDLLVPALTPEGGHGRTEQSLAPSTHAEASEERARESAPCPKAGGARNSVRDRRIPASSPR